MPRPRSPHGYSRSSANAMKHGVFTDGILKSRGPESCPHRRSCQVLRDEELRSACIPGADCPFETAFYRAFVEDAAATFSSARKWLSEPDHNSTIHELAIVSLQRQRLSTLLARDGFTKPKIHPISGLEYGVEESLAAGRYATALFNRSSGLMKRLVAVPVTD